MAIYICILPYVNNSIQMGDYTKYDKQIIDILIISRNIIIVSISILSLLFAIANRADAGIKNSYLLVPLFLIYFLYPIIYLNILLVISAVGIIFFILKKNYVSADSYFIFIILISIMLLILGLFLALIFESELANILRSEHESKIGIKTFEEDFFKYITEDKESRPYINLKIKVDNDWKFGYIDNFGNIKIPDTAKFDLDFATPFYTINQFGKKFQIAGISKGDVVEIIMKDKRLVMSYVSKYDAKNYEKRLEEFMGRIKTNILKEEVAIEKEIHPRLYQYSEKSCYS